MRVGIIGAGFGAQVHLPGFRSVPGIEVAGIADAGSGRARRIAAGYPGLRVCQDWRDLVFDRTIDLVSVATPPGAHEEIVTAVLAASKHVLCEKPLGRDVAESERLWQAAEQSRRVAVVNFQFRMEHGIAALKRQVHAGAIGRIVRFDVSWLTGGRANPESPWSWRHDRDRGGGVLSALASHVIDYLQWIAASPVARVYARGDILVSRRPDAVGQLRPTTAEDSCDLLGELASGARVRVRASNCYGPDGRHRIEVSGDRGRLVYEHRPPFTPDRAVLSLDTGAGAAAAIPLEMDAPAPGQDTRLAPFRRLVLQMVEAIHGGVAPELPTFSHALRVQRVIEAARTSITSGAEVRVCEPR